ncbi:MAG: Hsp70 family protein [Spirochaetales bacterium]|nr:Hsp70 family protein [Spirochaetales bacterium]
MTVGIDLGTTNSLIAFLDGDYPRLIPNRRGKTITPSVVGVDAAGGLLVGEAARNQAVGAAYHVKRLMGRRTTVALGDTRRSPEELSAAILRDLRAQASSFLAGDRYKAVVTVPAHFDERQRLATTEAALLAGFDAVSLLNEPTAAALPYAARDRNHERLVVFDFGGGTLDVTCLEREGREFTVRSTTGDGELGGSDIDRIICERLVVELRGRAGREPMEDPRLRHLMLQLAERAKIDLSELEETTVSIPFIGGGTATVHLNATITRDELDEAIAPLVERARSVLEDALEVAGYRRGGFDRLILAGGSSRLPVIRSMLTTYYDAPVADRINPEEVVAVGAVLYGESRKSGAFMLREALSSTLSVELADGSCVPILRKNQTVPTQQTRIFTTVAEDQQEAEIHLLQGDHLDAGRNQTLGRFVLRNIQRAPQGTARIAVTVAVNEEGLVSLRAGDRDTGASREIVTRAVPRTERREVDGDRGHYVESVLRRARMLRRVATGTLRKELDQILLSVRTRDASRLPEDTVVVLETLIQEVVISRTAVPERSHRAAS